MTRDELIKRIEKAGNEKTEIKIWLGEYSIYTDHLHETKDILYSEKDNVIVITLK